MSKFPKSKAAKAELLKAILRGEKTIADVQDMGYHIQLWREDEEDPGMLRCFGEVIQNVKVPESEYENRRISKAHFESEKLVSKATYLTLNL